MWVQHKLPSLCWQYAEKQQMSMFLQTGYSLKIDTFHIAYCNPNPPRIFLNEH